MLTCSLAADEILCSEKDNMTQVCVKQESLKATIKDNQRLLNPVGTSINVCGYHSLCDNLLLYLRGNTDERLFVVCLLTVCLQKPIRDRQAHYLHEVKAA